MTDQIKVKFKKDSPLAIIPTYAYEKDIGCDAHSIEEVTLPPEGVYPIDTGLKVVLSPGHALLICSRSGLACKNIDVVNSPGVVDPNFSGRIKVILRNSSKEPFKIEIGSKIAQFLILPVPKIIWEEVTDLPPSDRGENGFGSTGV